MAVFDFCPKGSVPETLPREPVQVVTMNGWTFSARPTTPYVKKIKLTLHGLRWEINPTTGLYDSSTNANINARRLEIFYQEHETWKPFEWRHPHTGAVTYYRFANVVNVPAAMENSDGLLNPLEITLIEHNPPMYSAVDSTTRSPLSSLQLVNPRATTGQNWSSALVGQTSGSTITASSSDGTTVSFINDQLRAFFTTVGTHVITVVETLANSPNSPRTTTLALSVSEPVVVTQPALSPLTLNDTDTLKNELWISELLGKTAGSTITASSSDGTSLSYQNNQLRGTFLTTGSKAITIIETLANSPNSPRTSTVHVNVTEIVVPTLNALSLADTTTTATQPWSSSIVGRTAGSSLSAFSSDGTVITVSNTGLSGTFNTAGNPEITLIEEHNSYANSPRITKITISVAAPAATIQNTKGNSTLAGNQVNGFSAALNPLDQRLLNLGV